MILRASTLQTHLLTIEGSCLFKVPPQGIKQKHSVVHVFECTWLHCRPAWCFLVVALGLWVANIMIINKRMKSKTIVKLLLHRRSCWKKAICCPSIVAKMGLAGEILMYKIQNAGKATFGWSNNPKLSVLWILLKTYSKQWIMKVNKGILYNVWWLFKFGNQAWTAGLKVLIYVQAAFPTESKGWKGAQPRASKAA